MATTPHTVEVRAELTVNGEPVAGALVVGPDDVLVLNLGPKAALIPAVEFIRRWMSDQHPDISARTVIVAAESMAVVRAHAAASSADVGQVAPEGTHPDVTPDGVSTVYPGRAGG